MSSDSYLAQLNARTRRYFCLLEPEFPAWLSDYIDTPTMRRQQFISTTCGTLYTRLFDTNYFYSSLDHSVAVALIVWHFTHDRRQTLAGLFHDIATPTFKHCVDFLNGDYLRQESTEDLTNEIIAGSPEIMALLKRDGIALAEVADYHLYPIADNDTPQLSADRLEYSFANAYFIYRVADYATIRRFYQNLEVGQDENGRPELQFVSPKVATEFVRITSKLSVVYRNYRTVYSMQLIADILKRLLKAGALTQLDLYTRREAEIIRAIEQSEFGPAFNKWRRAKQLHVASSAPAHLYAVRQQSKVRYIDPLVSGSRTSHVSDAARRFIDHNLSYNTDNYAYIDGIEL